MTTDLLAQLSSEVATLRVQVESLRGELVAAQEANSRSRSALVEVLRGSMCDLVSCGTIGGSSHLHLFHSCKVAPGPRLIVWQA